MKLLLPFRKAISLLVGIFWLGHSVDDTRNFRAASGNSYQKLPGRGPSCKFKRNFRGLHPEATSRVSGRFVTDRISTETPLELQKMSCVHQWFCCVVRQKNVKTQKTTSKSMDDPGPEEWTLRKSHFEAVGRLWNSSLVNCPPKSQNQVFLFTIPF